MTAVDRYREWVKANDFNDYTDADELSELATLADLAIAELEDRLVRDVGRLRRKLDEAYDRG